MKNNFTLSSDWIDSLYIRYDISNIINVNNHFYLYKNNDMLKCQTFFDFTVNDCDLKVLSKYILDGCKIRFSYINEGTLSKKLKEWAAENGYNYSIIDYWKNPKLQCNNVSDYLMNNKSTQVRKNYKKYLDAINDYTIKNSSNDDIISMWKDVLKIDYNSWKGKNNCDMKSLDREDLQYIFFLLNNPTNSSLFVLYKGKIPAAYSLMFRERENTEWYAVKWGASDYGRSKYLGIYCLFNHLLYLNKHNKKIKIDFWGRRSQTYDSLKSLDNPRMHIEIWKEVQHENFN